MDSKPVFYDPRGRRGTFVTRFGAVIAAIVAVLTTLLLIVAAFTIPYLPQVQSKTKATSLPGMPSKDLKRVNFLSGQARRQLAIEIARTARRPRNEPPLKGPNVVAGFYAPWEASGLASFRKHAAAMTHVMPQWIHLTADGTDLDFGRDFDPVVNPGNRDVIQIARQNRLSILPILDNQESGNFDPKRMSKLLADETAQRRVALTLSNFLVEWQFQGINLDFELVSRQDSAKFIHFLEILRHEFDKYHLTLTADIETDSNLPIGTVANLCDWVVLMAYDEHSEDDPAGPIASIDWCDQVLDAALDQIPTEKLVVGLGSYGYDWKEGKPTAENLTFQEALSDAAGYRSEAPSKVIQLDQSSLNNTFDYQDDDDKKHVVWMLDAVSVFNQWRSARSQGVKGAALWYLGSEDPDVWTFLDRRNYGAKFDSTQLEKMQFPYEISFVGRGEILFVELQPQNGQRTLSEDEESGLITGCTYEKYAFPYVIRKTGFIPGKLAITFDDGPDPQWTPQILDVLKAQHCPATFFVIGNSCESNPGLVADEYNDGMEVGNHSYFHPNMGTISDERDRLELNLTQLAIEGATGRSTTLFRPPYNADSEPETAEQIKPIVIATEMGYVTVCENVDPLDWDLKVPLGNGQYRPKTAMDIVQAVDGDLARRHARTPGEEDEGNVILLHDAGGDRSATVAALKILIPRLRAEGYEFVPVSTLMHSTRDKVMPPIPAKDRFQYLLAKIVLGATYGILWFLSVAFVLAIGLGLLRITVVTILALIERAIEKPIEAPGFKPLVSVLIAAYNEEAVVRRTVESVLASEYPIHEIIVIDDGSQDGTSRAVEEAFGGDARVRLITKENGGKASALNVGIEAAAGEILFCIDADTQLDPAALGLMVAHFHDEKIGAVAGNVRVGNPVNVITFWQSLEYTTSQNLDRRAYALLNAITVVPGAIGAWRTSAVKEVGEYVSDTLAEDMDLTWRLRMAGYRIENEPNAFAFTEAPQSFGGFFRQRFRWAYGTLQCLFKHRRALGRYQWFGWLGLPALWVFQVFFQALAPLVDIEVIISVVKYGFALAGAGSENGAQALGGETQTILRVAFLYAVFFAVELVSAAIATKLDRQRYGLLWWLFLQRFAYRQIMYGVIYRSLVRAVTGGRAGWGKLDRQGTVRVPVARS
jgi:poly-beta-1,6 N-acetyl-D-glucosamine synthase